MGHKNKIKRQIGFAPDQFAWLLSHADQTGVPYNFIVRQALEEYRQKKVPAPSLASINLDSTAQKDAVTEVQLGTANHNEE